MSGIIRSHIALALAALLFVRRSLRRLQMKDGRVALAELRALIGCREETRTPVLRTTDGLFVVQQDDEPGGGCVPESVANFTA